jgi:hypothetical protein
VDDDGASPTPACPGFVPQARAFAQAGKTHHSGVQARIPHLEEFRKAILYLHRDDLNFCMHHFDKVHFLDKVDHFIQARIDMSSIISDRAKANLCSLPKIIIPDF